MTKFQEAKQPAFILILNRDEKQHTLYVDDSVLYTQRKNSFEADKKVFVNGKSDSYTSGYRYLSHLFPELTADDLIYKYLSHKSDKEYILTSMLQSEFHENGVSSTSEEFFSEWLHKERLVSLNCINKIFWENYDSKEAERLNTTIGILHLLSHFDYYEVYPTAQVIALAALSNGNSEVCDYALKCFDNWSNIECLDNLKAIRFHSQWLSDYADAIIAELESR